MKKFLFILFLMLSFAVKSQDIRRTSIWYFGENAGIDFNTDPPTALTDGQINTSEGCATLSDTNGNLILYSDGKTIWNKHHRQILNSDSLFGNQSSSNGVLILPMPDIDSIFYVFYTNAVEDKGFNYSIVSFTGNDSGQVIIKNKNLLAHTCEAIACISHKNGKDYWIIVHEYGSANFFSYLLTSEGIISCSRISDVGSSINGDSFLVQNVLKASNDGKLLANSFYDIGSKIEVLNFDTESGEIKYNYTLSGLSLPIGIEFSPNNKLLYVAERDKGLSQYDLSSNIESIINSSKTKIYTPVGYSTYSLQQSKNKKIYLSVAGPQYLSFINYPDSVGINCDFQYNGLNLTKKALVGLPTFNSSYFHLSAVDFKYTINCVTNTCTFSSFDTINATAYKWYFLKGSKKDSSTLKSPSYSFADTGNYTVSFIAKASGRSDTVIKHIYIYPKYNLNLGKDTVICAVPLTLNAGSGQFCYTWQDSSSNSTFHVNVAGTYSVKVVSQNYCIQFDTIKVSIANPPAKPTITRNSDTLKSSQAFKYQWLFNSSLINGANQPFYKVPVNGYYQVLITDTNGCKAVSDSFNFKYLDVQDIASQKLFKIYPNSAKDILFIESPENAGNYQVIITDVWGKEILFKAFTNKTETINIGDLAAGVYAITISVNNHIVEIHKIIKQP